MIRTTAKCLSVMIPLFLTALAWAEAPKKTQYRGFTICSMDRETLEDAAKNWHANQVRYMMCPGWGRKPGETQQQCWKRLLATVGPGLDIAKELGLAVALDLHQIPNDNPAPIPPNPDPEKNPYWDSIHSSKDESYLRVMIDCWRDLAEICKDRDQVIWFDLLNEPLEWSVIHIYPHYAPQWPQWAQKTINEIRKIDKKHPIVVEPGPGMNCWGFKAFPPLKDPCMDLIYSFHQYQPFEYTHQGVYSNRKILPYPGATGDSGGGMWDAKRLEQEMAPAVEFQKKYGVRIWIGEFSVVRWAPDSEQWLKDSIEFFEKHGWDWSYHSLREAYEWRLTEGEQALLVRTDKDGNKVPLLAVPTMELSKQGYEYWPWGTPGPSGIEAPQKPKGLTGRGRVVLHYMLRNLKGSSQPAK